MRELLKKFEDKAPEIVFEWNDSHTTARGWVVINSLRGGAAGGGTRMRIGLDKNEVLSLAKTMEVKFTVSGPPIGGAKSGIDYDPNAPDKNEVLERWYKAVIPILKNYYGTGGDLNVDEIHEVIPITERFGLWHPQEGVLEGHFNPSAAEKIKKIGQLRVGVSKVIEDAEYAPTHLKKLLIADMITGYGVAESLKHYYQLSKIDLTGKKVLVQGWGNVGSAAAYYLAKQGARVTGIIDRVGGLFKNDGFTFEEIEELFIKKQGNKLVAENIIPFENINKNIWAEKFDIFIPCAASRLVQLDQIQQLIDNGLEVVSCGANVPFADKEIFFGPISEKTDNQVALIPDFISNCGMARVFAYLMQDDIEMSDRAIFKDSSKVIFNALEAIYKKENNFNQLTKKAFERALKQLI